MFTWLLLVWCWRGSSSERCALKTASSSRCKWIHCGKQNNKLKDAKRRVEKAGRHQVLSFSALTDWQFRNVKSRSRTRNQINPLSMELTWLQGHNTNSCSQLIYIINPLQLIKDIIYTHRATEDSERAQLAEPDAKQRATNAGPARCFLWGRVSTVTLPGTVKGSGTVHCAAAADTGSVIFDYWSDFTAALVARPREQQKERLSF